MGAIGRGQAVIQKRWRHSGAGLRSLYIPSVFPKRSRRIASIAVFTPLTDCALDPSYLLSADV